MRTICVARFWLTDVGNLLEEKKRLRALLKERRATLDMEQKKEWDRAVAEKIAASKLFREASAVLLYAPTRGEIDLIPLVRLARQMGKTVAFPRCDVETNTMQFYILAPDARLVRGAYGIAEPPSDAALCVADERTLCLVPALTFSLSGARLGYGKGYYDRFLADFPGVTAGVVYQSFLVKRVPAEAHDRPVQFLFTERGTIRTTRAESGETDAETPPKNDTGAKTDQNGGDAPRKKHFWSEIGQKLFARAPRQTAVTAGGGEEKEAREAPLAHVLHAPPILVAVVFALLALSRLLDPLLGDRKSTYAVVILLQVLILFVPAAVYAFRRGKDFLPRLRLRLPRVPHLWFLFCMLVVMISGGLLCEILTGGISSLTGNFKLYDTFVARSDGSVAETLCLILAYGILPAFCEELIWRAFLCAEYEKFGVGVSVTVSALLFAMLHFSFPLFLSYLFLGALLAGAMYATRSFFAAVLLHLCYNLFCLFGQPYLSAFYVNAGSNEIFIFCLVVLLLLFGAFAVGEARKIYHVWARRNSDSSYTAPLPVKRLPRQLWNALRSPAVAVCAGIWLIMSILNLVL